MCGSEIESEVLAEFALFSHLHRFGSVALRWCSRQEAPSNALDKRIFAGVQTSFYSVFKVMALSLRHGLIVQDTYTKKKFFIMDIGMSMTAKVNMGFASRIIPLFDWAMCTGAVIPVVKQTYQALEPYLRQNILPEMIGQDRPFSGKKEMSFQATIIRTAIANNAFDSIAHG